MGVQRYEKIRRKLLIIKKIDYYNLKQTHNILPRNQPDSHNRQ